MKVKNRRVSRLALGVIPDYLFDGKGMRVDGSFCRTNLHIAAGLQKGDIVVQLGGS